MVQTEAMPALPQQRIGRPGDSCTMTMFGAAGDLTRRKLIPALYNLAKNQLLSREGVEFFRLFPDVRDSFQLSTAARMSATFPFVSPAGDLPTKPRRRVVDARA